MRSYTHEEAFRFRRSIASQAAGFTATIAIPSGAARHFWELVMLMSTPQSSVRTSSPASDETVSRTKRQPCRFASRPTSAAG